MCGACVILTNSNPSQGGWAQDVILAAYAE